MIGIHTPAGVDHTIKDKYLTIEQVKLVIKISNLARASRL